MTSFDKMTDWNKSSTHDQIPSRYVTRAFKPFSVLSHFQSRDLGSFCVRYYIEGIIFNCLHRLVSAVEVIITEENSY